MPTTTARQPAPPRATQRMADLPMDVVHALAVQAAPVAVIEALLDRMETHQ